MELKLEKCNLSIASLVVLIVPLWNWNYCTWRFRTWWHQVLIVPLWNWNRETSLPRSALCGFNRTFMELKYFSYVQPLCCRFVLIVPLWNWNRSAQIKLNPSEHVLIVPLWNWNAWWGVEAETSRCFNRTFMELKYVKSAAEEDRCRF